MALGLAENATVCLFRSIEYSVIIGYFPNFTALLTSVKGWMRLKTSEIRPLRAGVFPLDLVTMLLFIGSLRNFITLLQSMKDQLVGRSGPLGPLDFV